MIQAYNDGRLRAALRENGREYVRRDWSSRPRFRRVFRLRPVDSFGPVSIEGRPLDEAPMVKDVTTGFFATSRDSYGWAPFIRRGTRRFHGAQ